MIVRTTKQIIFISLLILLFFIAGCIPEYKAQYNSSYVVYNAIGGGNGTIKNVYNETISIRAVWIFKSAESTLFIKELKPNETISLDYNNAQVGYYINLGAETKEYFRSNYVADGCWTNINLERKCK